jgi:hypothetical protein
MTLENVLALLLSSIEVRDKSGTKLGLSFQKYEGLGSQGELFMSRTRPVERLLGEKFISFHRRLAAR